MQLIPNGTFLMGSVGWGEFEGPVREVFLGPFRMDDAPVTNQEFSAFTRQTGYRTTAEIKGFARGYEQGEIKEIRGLSWKTYFTEERADHPVVLVSWHDAAAFAQWAGKRLPMEAEWEKAARGGLEQKLYPWGDNPPDALRCNFGRQTVDMPPTTAIRSFAPNAYGLYDMAGNVWQWCSDWFSETAATKVRRGASFNIMQAFRLRCANRGAFKPDDFAINIGFRCVKDTDHD